MLILVCWHFILTWVIDNWRNNNKGLYNNTSTLRGYWKLLCLSKYSTFWLLINIGSNYEQGADPNQTCKSATEWFIGKKKLVLKWPWQCSYLNLKWALHKQIFAGLSKHNQQHKKAWGKISFQHLHLSSIVILKIPASRLLLLKVALKS